jgi:hypothetical protein
MKNLTIYGTLNTPLIKIDVDNKMFEISGISLPENPHEFYEPVIEYIMNYNQNELTIIWDLQYCNSSSTKSILLLLKKCVESINKVKVIWIYDFDDDDIKELGEDFQHSINTVFEFRVRE